MRNKVFALISGILFISAFMLLAFYKQFFYPRMSPQASINPRTIKEEISQEKIGFFNNEPVLLPKNIQNLIAQKSSSRAVLGDMTSGEKRIEVDLANQRLYAYEGDKLIYNFLISSGKWGRTPTGVFQIWGKFRATKMEGGKKELNTYYYLPNVPYVMFFDNDQIPAWKGFSIHGTYWHSNFGTPMSHGCINMKTEEAALIYEWASPSLQGKTSIRASNDNPGTKVVIYGEAPRG